jgi:hypothetical protein
MNRSRLTPRKSAARHRARLAVVALEGRCTPAALSIGGATAVEGGSTLKYVDQFVAAGSGGLTNANISVFGTDGNLYVADEAANTVQRYDGVTGAFKDTFVTAGSGGLQFPASPVFGPDGNLYVSSFKSGQVLRYDGSSGAFLGAVASGLAGPVGLTFGADGSLYIAEQGANDVLRYNGSGVTAFVTAGSGGLSQPRKVVFQPDGDLYVASQGTKQVLRYSATTGAFIGVFATQPPTEASTGTMWLAFGADGYLYTTARDMPGSSNASIVRFNAATGAYVDRLPLGRDGWAFQLGADGLVYESGNAAGGFVDRFGPSSLAAFTVSLDSPSESPVTVNYATADGSATVGRNYVATSGTLTFAPGQTTRTILVQSLDDGFVDPTETFTVNLSNPVGATIAGGQGTGTILDGDSTKFYVADSGGPVSLYRYALAGNARAVSALASGDTAPRGVAANATGTTEWVVDANKNVYVYNPSGALLGSWSAGGLQGNSQLTGIATNGTDIWLVDSSSDKVYKYAGAASRLSGSQSAASSFGLSVHGHNGNTNPQDIVTDGTSIWVVDGTAHAVYKYTLSGSLLGSWTIDAANAHPTGITINSNNVSDVWIVDNSTDMVYDYTAAAGRTSGSQNAVSTFSLNPYDTNPQGIADPPPADTLVTPLTVGGRAMILATPVAAGIHGTDAAGWWWSGPPKRRSELYADWLAGADGAEA